MCWRLEFSIIKFGSAHFLQVDQGGGNFWLGFAEDEPQNPQTNSFRVSWLSTYDSDHPSFQKVRANRRVSLLIFFQVFVEYGQTSLIRAECVLVTGVRLSRMTEPNDSQEWWILPEKMRKRIEACRISWQGNDSFVPLALKPLKHRKRAMKRAAVDHIPSVLDPVSEVCFLSRFNAFSASFNLLAFAVVGKSNVSGAHAPALQLGQSSYCSRLGGGWNTSVVGPVSHWIIRSPPFQSVSRCFSTWLENI